MRWRYFSAKPLDKRELHRNRLKVSRAAACLLRITLPGPSNQSIRPTSCVQCRAEPTSPTPHECGFFIFIFYKFFLQKYIFIFEIYRNIPRPPRCRAAGLFCKKIRGKFAPGSLKDRPPGSGAAGPQAARQRGGGHRPPARQQGGRLPLRYIRVWLPPHPSFASLKIQKKRKRGWRERGEALPDYRDDDCR